MVASWYEWAEGEGACRQTEKAGHGRDANEEVLYAPLLPTPAFGPLLPWVEVGF